MAESKLLLSIARSATEEVQVAINEYKGKKYLDLRIYYTTDEGATWSPTKKGVTFSPDKLEELKAAIDTAIEAFSEELVEE
jgi:hypothetical protein